VNYCVAQDFSGEERVFKTLDDFCKWVFNKMTHKGYTFIAHYAKGYDVQFIAAWLIAHSVKPNIIHNGQKMLQLEVKQDYNIRFIDSFSFTLMPSRNFPKTFGLTELAKGYFSHKFNIDENQNYIGSYPDKEYYGYGEMTKANRDEFTKWYETVKDETFNFKTEMYKYCKSDVDILRRGCLELRRLFIQIANIDPFQYITIASVCKAIHRNSFLPKNTIAIYNENPTYNYSNKSIEWLKYISQKCKINIKHACNGGEVEININGKTLKVDGYCDCYYHGCRHCYDELPVNKVSQYNMKYLNERTMTIDNALWYYFITIWEHDFDKNKEPKATTLEEFDLVEPPKLRDGFYGGRCEPIKLIHDFKNTRSNTGGKYIDVVSLYPTVMFYDKYPVGHPIKIQKPKDYNPEWFGFVYCRVLPPRGLFLPVLPFKQKTKQAHKLMFWLCRTCMERLETTCAHHKSAKCSPECGTKQCHMCNKARRLLKDNCLTCYQQRNSDCTH